MGDLSDDSLPELRHLTDMTIAPDTRKKSRQPNTVNEFETSNLKAPPTKVTSYPSKLEVEINIAEYRPEELSINTEEGALVILAKRETSKATRQFERKISLPRWVKPEKMDPIKCKDGTMTVSFPREREETRRGGLPNTQVTYVPIVLDAKNVR